MAKDAIDALRSGAADLPEMLAADGAEIDPLPVLAPGQDGVSVVVFPLLHGPLGEDGTIQGLLELADVPFVGSGVLGSALSMDKVKAKEVVAQHRIPQAHFAALHEDETSDLARCSAAVDSVGGYPVFVKPANMGSSIGVSKVHDAAELADAVALACSYDEWVLVEESVTGREIEVAVLGNRTPRASVPGEVRSASVFYDYEDKYLDGRAELLVPAPLDESATAEVRDLAVQAFRALRAEGMARVDFFYEEGGRGFLLNEINTIPGFTPISMYPKLWDVSGLPYPELIDELVDLALDRHERRAARRVRSRQPSLHRSSLLPAPADGDSTAEVGA
jgi:D-alanine-D-alanine ligase